MIVLGVQVIPLKPFLLEHYAHLKGEELNEAWTIAKASIHNNDLIVETSQRRINNEKLKDEDKNTLLETIEDLNYQNNTNNEIIKLLESNIVKADTGFL